MKKKTTTVWRAILDGECKQIAESEENLWHELRNNNFWYIDTRDAQWTVTSQDEELPVVCGTTNDGALHINWACPFCNEIHDTDRYDENSPSMWYCENGEGIAIVTWEQ